jgi:CDP-diacylglycerol--glycerol-3-phosphate 3-phosphatidyltransferase
MTANQATALGIFFIIASSISLFLGFSNPDKRFFLLVFPIFITLRLAANTLDGMLSREKGSATVMGEVFNETLDVGGDTLIYGVFLFIPSIPKIPVIIFLLSIWAAEFYGVLGKGMPNGFRQHTAFLGGKPDRAMWIGLLSVIIFFYPNFINYISYYLCLVTFFVALTAFLRIRKTLEVAKGKKYESYTWIGK